MIPAALLAVLAFTAQGKGEAGSPIDLESVNDSELPKQVELTEALKVRLLNERGGGGVVGLPAGARVDVTGRSGNMLEIVFAKSAGQIDIAKTTALEEVAKIRAANKAAEEKRAALASTSESPIPNEKPATSKGATKAENEPEEEIPVNEYQRLLLAYPWTFSVWSGKPNFSVPGDIPRYTYRFDKNKTWTRTSLQQPRPDGSPYIDNKGKWTLDGDRLKMTKAGLRFDPNEDLITIKFLSRHLLSFGGSLWTAEIEQKD